MGTMTSATASSSSSTSSDGQTAAPKMKMRAMTRGNNDSLKMALTRLGWTQSDLARHSKISFNIISDIINLAKPPTEKEADAIQRALGKKGEYLDVLEFWPATFAMPKCRHEQQPCSEIQFECLWNHPEAMQLAAPEREN